MTKLVIHSVIVLLIDEGNYNIYIINIPIFAADNL